MRIALWLALVLSMITVVAARADPICAEIQAMVESLRTKQPQPRILTGADRCDLAVSLGSGQSYHCQWSFGFRDDAARRKQAELQETARTCLGSDADITDDQPVNHPDSYVQRSYRAGDVSLSVSLKDKSALKETLVFFSVSTWSEL